MLKVVFLLISNVRRPALNVFAACLHTVWPGPITKSQLFFPSIEQSYLVNSSLAHGTYLVYQPVYYRVQNAIRFTIGRDLADQHLHSIGVVLKNPNRVTYIS